MFKKPYLLTLLAIMPALLLKYAQRAWSSDELWFLLYPVQKMVGVFIGQSARYLAGEGYLFSQFIIEKSCAGINFLVITWCALAFLSLQNQLLWGRKLKALLWSIPLCYLTCVLANTFRILCAIVLQGLPGLHGPAVHEALGVVVYLSMLLLLTTLFHYHLNRPKHAKLA